MEKFGNYEKHNSEDAEAKRLIESAGLEDTPAGKYMKKEPVPSDEELKEEGREMSREEFLEYQKELDHDLFEWIKNLSYDGKEFNDEEKEFVEQGILSGDYREIEYWLKKSKEEKEARELLERVQNNAFQKALDAFDKEIFDKARDITQRNKNRQPKHRRRKP